MTGGQIIAALAATFGVALILGLATAHNSPSSLNDWSYWYRVTRHQDNVHISIVPRCGDPKYPLRVTIDNKSSRTIPDATKPTASNGWCWPCLRNHCIHPTALNNHLKRRARPIASANSGSHK